MTTAAIVLSHEELIALTGYKRPSKQCNWLMQNGFKYKLNRANHPKVDRRYYETKMGLTKAGSTSEPDWSKLKGAKP